MAHCLIITGGSIDLDAAFAYLKDIKYDYLIAADHGMDACRALKLIPNLIMGDFDSASNVEHFRKIEGIKWEKFPSHKNETDTELALRKAVELGNDEITILGAFGTRMDHTLANIYLLDQAKDAKCVLVDGHNRVRMIQKEETFLKSEGFGKYISFLPFAGEVTHLYLQGFAYELEDFYLPASCIRGISNEYDKEIAKVWFDTGKLLCIESVD